MPISAPSSRREFEGFSAFYDAEIAPFLQAKEKDRKDAVVNYVILLGAAAVFALAVAFFGPLGETNREIAMLTGFAGFGGATWLLNRTRTDITHGLLDRICQQLKFGYRLKLERPDYHKDFKKLKLLPDFHIERWEDEVRGSHAGSDFVFCESHLKRKSGKNSTRTVFHGQIFVIDYPKRFLGTTVLKRDLGVLNRLGKPGKGFQNVGLASSEFEKAFEAWSTDQVEARDLLDPIVLERFQALETLFNGKSLRAAFDDGKLLIAIETGDRLNMGSIFKPLEDAARVETILKEFDIVFDLIDVLLKRVDRPIDGAFSVDHVRAKSA